MKRRVSVFLIVLLMLLMAIPAMAAEGRPYANHEKSELEWEVLNITNRMRIAEGLHPLATKASLGYASRIRAEEIFILLAPGHIRPDGRGPFTALSDVGVPTPWGTAAANAAIGQANPTAAMNWWKNSPGHWNNIINPNVNYIGVGHYFNERHHWHQFFMGGAAVQRVRISEDVFFIEQGGYIEDTDAKALIDNIHGQGAAYFPILSEMITGLDSSVVGVHQVFLHYRETVIPFKVRVLSDGEAAVTVNLNVNAADASVSPANIKVEVGEIYGKMPIPTRRNFLFYGWFTAQVGGVRVNADTVVTNTADHTLYAHWLRWGDVNEDGRVDFRDLDLLQRHINFGHIIPVELDLRVADVVSDGRVDSHDLALLQRYVNFRHIIPIELGVAPK